MNLLEQLANGVSTLTIGDAKAIVEAYLGTPISLVDPDSLNPRTNEPREVRCDAKLASRLRTGKRIELRAVFTTSLLINGRDAEEDDSDESPDCRRDVARVDHPAELPTPRAPRSEQDAMRHPKHPVFEPKHSDIWEGNTYSDVLLERFVREMDSQERRRDFVWIGYVAKTMLPGFGLSEDEANSFLHRVEAEELVIRSQRPNPKNPEFPSTGIQLNRGHPRVQRVLRDMKFVPKRFPLGAIRGEPLSQTIIRERR